MTPTGFHLSFNRPKKGVLQLDHEATFISKVLRELLEKDSSLGVRAMRVKNAENSPEIEKLCPLTSLKQPACNTVAERKFRTIDGSCNNLKETYNGRTMTPFQRILNSEYGGKSKILNFNYN